MSPVPVPGDCMRACDCRWPERRSVVFLRVGQQVFVLFWAGGGSMCVCLKLCVCVGVGVGGL